MTEHTKKLIEQKQRMIKSLDRVIDKHINTKKKIQDSIDRLKNEDIIKDTDLTQEQLINGAVDCFGYSEEDFNGMKKDDVLEWLNDAQLKEIIKYYK